jgi:cob(I)alamin adenosyltransferase
MVVQESHPFPRGLRACGRREVSWLPGLPLRAFPVPMSGPVARCACGGASPVTVAGPRRIHTGFPVHRPWVDRDSIRGVTVNLTRIYTRLGDGGETHLGDMSRVPKTHPRIEAYGTVDELNAQLGVALAGGGLSEKYAAWIQRVQNDLFDVGADISVPHGGDRERLRVKPEQTTWLEEVCDEVNGALPPLRSFVLPGGTPAAAQLHVCRTVCRRAERRTIDCGDEVNTECVKYLNRLSDLLFILSRGANLAASGEEPLWQPGAGQ